MTDDIVARLRSWDHCWPARWLEGATAEAADEIERLRVELAKERERADAHYRALENVTAKNERLMSERDALRAELAAERERRSETFEIAYYKERFRQSELRADALRQVRDGVTAERNTLRAELAACEADGERLVELSQANVRRLEAALAERDALRALLREARNIMPRDWAFWSRIDAVLKGDGDGLE